MNNDILYKEECYQIIGACMNVHKELGPGFLEAVYQESLTLEFLEQGIPFEKEKDIRIVYKGKTLDKCYKADFLCFDNIIVEVKALSEISNDHISQLLNYLKATKLRVGLLVNFGSSRLVYKRLIL
ncbi:MAG: GxxExxY protein [Caldisericia bacterium]|jgi:GxxExxY protein|nr:GxxExxY protein [Caldisericia bacterium]